MQKSLQLAEDYYEKYNIVITYRPDVLLLKNIDLSTYDNNKIYVNGPLGHDGWTNDFHFIMNDVNAEKFKHLYNSIENGNPHHTHYWINNYVKNFLKMELFPDNIIPGLDQEVLRKIYSTTISNFKTPVENLLQYGLTKEEILTYIG